MSNCQETARIWKQLASWWSNMTGQHITLSERDIMLGLSPRLEKIEMEYQLNNIILATKWKIHANKQLGLTTCFYQVLLQVRHLIDTLDFIADRNGKTDKHLQLWEKILIALT
jgi:hypothetical protein